VLEANRQDFATKGDFVALKNELKNDIALLKGDLAALKNELKADIEKLRLEVKAENEKTKAELIKWNVGAILAAAGLAMAIARLFFHP